MKLNETCSACGLTCTKDLKTGVLRNGSGVYADPCLGILPGVKYGCCGHGGHDGYLFFENGVTVRFVPTVIEKATYSKHHAFNAKTTREKN